jgi:hypothetical protein
LEVVAYRDQRFHAAKAVLREIGKEALGDVIDEQVIAQRLLSHYMMRYQPVFPPGTPTELRRSLLAKRRHEFRFSTWPHLPHKALGGRTPAEASKDPRLHIRTLAALLLLESTFDRDLEGTSDELHRHLGLPVAHPIDPAGQIPGHVPLVRLHRLMMEKLTDEELVVHFRRAASCAAFGAARRLAQEITSRDGLRDANCLDTVYAVLVDTEPNNQEKLDLIAKGRQASKALRKSSAPWDLRELTVRVELDELEPARQVFNHLVANHLQEPGVREQLSQIASIYGIDRLRPQAVAGRQTIAVAAGTAAEPGRIWTPDEERGGQSGAKPGIWLPGQE